MICVVNQPEAQTLVTALVEAVPALGPVVEEHIESYGELLPHVLFGDLTRFVLAAAAKGDETNVRTILDLLDTGMVSGDPDLVNLISASFVENVGVWDRTMDSFISTWPEHLRTEAERVRNL
jgi:hypothetical protein